MCDGNGYDKSMRVRYLNVNKVCTSFRKKECTSFGNKVYNAEEYLVEFL